MQTIETAPTDEAVLIWDPKQETWRVASLMTAMEDGEKNWVYARQLSIHSEDGKAVAFIVRTPTHWHPLPKPPRIDDRTNVIPISTGA